MEDAQLRKEDEHRKIEHEQRMKQLRSETESLKRENARLGALKSNLIQLYQRLHLNAANAQRIRGLISLLEK